MGNLLRQYWHPVASASQLEQEPVIEVDLLGEELVLFRDRSGRVGLLERNCAHRQTSLAFAMPEENGVRCAYHGWVWDADGKCLEQPSEPEGSTYFERVTATAYPARELGGLVFAYLGTGTPPHPQEAEFFRSRIAPKPMKGMDFDLFDDGVIERHFCVDQQEHSWLTGSPIFFPSTSMMVRNEGVGTLIFVVPLSDNRTWFLEHRAMPLGGRSLPDGGAPYHEVPGTDNFGKLRVGTANGQDHMAVVTQGQRTSRQREHLGATDAGLIMYRQLLLDQAQAFADGAEPINTRRGLAVNRQIDGPPAKTVTE
jgi:5,5'-dehydrodivanillate O-demethylase